MSERFVSNFIPDAAKNLLNEGKWEEAVVELDRALQTNPREISLWREKANTLIALNKLEEALACYQRMLEIEPRDSSIHKEKADVFEWLGRDDDALQCYDEGLQLNRLNATLLQGKAQLLGRMGRTFEAIDIYDKQLELLPQDVETLVAKGDALIADGQIDRAVSTCFEPAARIDPKLFGAEEWTRRGDNFSDDQDKNDRALQFYERALLADENYAPAFQGKARVLRQTPETRAEALACLDKAISLDPGNGWIKVDKGNIYFDQEDFQSAAACFAEAVACDAKYQVGWLNLAIAKSKLRLYDEAVLAADKVIELDPESADGWLERGYCLGELERHEEAIAAYDKALALDEDNFWVNNNKGWSLMQLHRNEEAAPFFQKAISIDPNVDAPWLNQADNLIELRHYDEALEDLKKGLETVSDKLELLAKCAFICTEFRYQHDQALNYYEQCRKLDSANVRVASNIAECLIKMGRYTEGRAEAETVVGHLPDPDWECAMSIVVLASYALEGDVAGRARQFEVVAEHFKTCCSGGKPRTWNFGGLVNVLRTSNISAESKFLVLTAIDVQHGNLPQNDLLYFGKPKPEAAETTTAVQTKCASAGD